MDLLAAERIAEDLAVLAPGRAVERAQEVRRRVRSGRWQRAGRCIVMHNGPLTNDQRMWCALLSPGGLAALARESALAAQGVKGLGEQPLTVLVPWARTPGAIAGVRYVRSRHFAAADLAASLPPRCTPARAVVDAARRASAERARTLLAMVVQQRKATPDEIRAVLARIGPVRREVLLRLTLEDVEGGAHSLPELRFMQLVRDAELPLPTRQAVRQRPDGRYYLDAAWDEYGLVVEVDGSHHREASQWEADVLRHDELMIGGDRMLRLLSWWVRDRPELVVDLLRRALTAAGWRP